MEGIEIIVELKTGRRVRGLLSSADEYMNLTLDHIDKDDFQMQISANLEDKKSDFRNIERNGAENILSSCDIKGSKVRYIQFPDNADLNSIVRTGTERERMATKKYGRTKRKVQVDKTSK